MVSGKYRAFTCRDTFAVERSQWKLTQIIDKHLLASLDHLFVGTFINHFLNTRGVCATTTKLALKKNIDPIYPLQPFKKDLNYLEAAWMW